ncbi:MAG: AraC family transcriptional regulator [Pyrinomonadaceae bacterium]
MDRIFIRPQYAIHYREAARLKWTSEARNDYGVLFLLGGKLFYELGDHSGELTAQGVLLLEPNIMARANGHVVKLLTLTLAPTFVLDYAIRARLAGTGAQVAFRTPILADEDYLSRIALDLARELKTEQAGQEIIVTAFIEQIAVHLLRHHCNLRRADTLELSRVGLVDRRIRRAVELMHAHLAEDLPLEEIAAAAHLSTFHFARLFKKLMGTSPHAYLAALRAAQAQVLLAETDFSVTQIGARVGYSSPSHFTRAFREATGLTPRAFRNALVKT